MNGYDQGTVSFKNNEETRFVGVPGMNAIGQHLGRDLVIQLNTQVGKISAAHSGHELFDSDGNSLGVYDQLIVAVPAFQAAGLLKSFPSVAAKIASVDMDPCWATMASFSRKLTDQWAGAFVHHSALSWVARNATKPGRSNQFENLVLHATPDWTKANLDWDKAQAADLMLEAFWEASGIEPVGPEYTTAHRWRYAIPTCPKEERCIFDESFGVVACGDWAGGPRVEGAFLSGMAAAGRVLGTLQPRQKSEIKQGQLF